MFLPIGDVNPSQRVPYVNYALMGINIAAFFLFGGFGGGARYQSFVESHGLIPTQLQPMDFATSIFLHANFMHLLGNMLFLWICGDNVEDRFGHVGYLVMYLLSGLAAALAHVAMEPDSTIPCIGASGAIAGVLGAYVVLFPQARIKFFYWWYISMGVTYVRAVWAIGFWFVEQFFLGSMSSVTGGAMTGVAYWAHVGGFVLGAGATFGLTRMKALGGGGPVARTEPSDWLERATYHDDRRYRW